MCCIFNDSLKGVGVAELFEECWEGGPNVFCWEAGRDNCSYRVALFRVFRNDVSFQDVVVIDGWGGAERFRGDGVDADDGVVVDGAVADVVIVDAFGLSKVPGLRGEIWTEGFFYEGGSVLGGGEDGGCHGLRPHFCSHFFRSASWSRFFLVRLMYFLTGWQP